MARIKNVVKKAESIHGTINTFYDITGNDVTELIEHYKLPYELACAAFRIGYMQGSKAEQAKMKKEGAKSGRVNY